MAVKAVTGAVFEVTDASGQEHRVTIHGIRVPKMDENFGFESRASLSTFVMNKPVMIKLRRFTKDVDTIAEVFADGSNIGLEQIRSGMAWLVPEEIAGLSEAEQKDYLDAAIAAKSGKYGLWSGKKGVNPLTGEAGEWNAAPPATELPMSTVASPVSSYREPSQRPPSSFVNKRTNIPAAEDQTAVPEAVIVPRKVERPAVEEPKETAAPPAARPKPAPGKRTFIRGPFGGCYYINSNGNKSYVDRSACD
jgi:endonuclease YncB( thermonuclease family)